MYFKLKPDFQQVKKRYDAFWHQEVIDRPPVSIILPVENPPLLPEKNYPSEYEKWTDIEFRAERLAMEMENYDFYADALPIVLPDMGLEIFSAWCGCSYHFAENTVWSSPCLDNITEFSKAKFNQEHILFKKTIELTKKLLAFGKNNFIVGLPELHPGADHLAAMRGQNKLALDLIDNPQGVLDMLDVTYQEFFQVYDIFYTMLKQADMPITSWVPLINSERYNVISSEFTCMISPKMFDGMFLPWIIKEAQFYDKSLYFLDGEGALAHLDSLLEVKEIDAIRWEPRPENQQYAKWADVYKKIQQAGKSVMLAINLEELAMVFETLNPEGVWFSEISGIEDRDTADKVLKRIRNWK